MSQLIVGEDQQPNEHQSNGKNMLGESSLLNSIPGKIIEVTGQKQKKEVIEIDDSEERQEIIPRTVKPKQRKNAMDSRKPKRIAIKCLLCKENGKKVAMKACLDCKGYFHIACLEQQGELVTRYRCRKCRHHREQIGESTKKGEKTQKGNDEKMQGRRLQKEKRREEQQKKMQVFQQRYPYYFQEERVKFPIEDKLLFIYRELFEITQSIRPKPINHPLIPSPLLGNFLQIENFFSTFKEELGAYGEMPSNIRKDIFYLSLTGDGLDSIFCSLLECLLKVYLSDIFDKNKTDNVRILNEHPFFTLLTHLNDNQQLSQQIVVKSARQIIRYLGTIPSMKRAFQNMNYPQEHNLLGKIDLIVGLISGLSQIDEFHELVSIKSQKMQQLTKQKTELVAQLKIDEAQNLSNNQKLKDMNVASKEMEQSQEGITRQLTKELDKHKKKIQKLATQQTKSEETIKQIRSKIGQIGKTMPFLTSQILFLGQDRNCSEYFFYIREPNRIYVKNRSYLLNKNENFMLFEGKESILQIIKYLNNKGLHQKHLTQNIQSLLKDEIITNNIIPINEEENGFMIQQHKYTSVSFELILQMIRQTEESFSTYLTVKKYQWAAQTVREMFMEQLMMITDLHILKEQLRSLQQNFLFAEYSTSQIINKAQEESDQQKFENREGRKKVPIRIWGINSEKTKKYWLEYLEECIDAVGIWLCTFIFKANVDKYVKKKMQAYYQEMAKKQKYRNRQIKERGRPPLIKYSERLEKKVSKQVSSSSSSSQEVEEERGQNQFRRPNLRKRKQKKMNIDSDDGDMEDERSEDDEGESSSQDCCQECGEYGEMLCCDTCPKVYHRQCLKMKDVPEGQWSCYKCLQKMSNQRQTRSRVKKMSKNN